MTEQHIPPWERNIPESDRRLLDTVMPKRTATIGPRPALLVIDVTYGFTGTQAVSLAEAIAEYSTSCGDNAWKTLTCTRALIDAFREQGRPVIWTTGDPEHAAVFGRATARSQMDSSTNDDHRRDEIHEIVAPHGYGVILAKSRASAFFGTPLGAYLTREHVDTVVITGGTTSGCVRASAVDAFSSGLSVFVAADCCYDRSTISNDVSLFDLSHKYATVQTSDKLIDQLHHLTPLKGGDPCEHPPTH